MTAIALTPMARRLSMRLDTLAPASFLAVLLALGAVMLRSSVFNDPDTYWHIVAGNWMIDHRQVLHRDVFSFSVAGHPWASHEWLAEVIMALAYRAAGWTGVRLLFAGALGLSLWLLARQFGRWLSGAGQVAMMMSAFLLIGPTVLARPHLLMLPILVAWTLEMLAAREALRAPRWWFAPLMALWANLHGSFVFGFVLAAGFGLEALTEEGAQPLRVIRGWGLFGLMCLAAALATPHGISGLVAPFKIMGMGTLDTIIEWKPASFAKFNEFEAALLVTLFVGFVRGVRVPLVRTVMMLFILHMALEHQRHELVLAVVASLILARPVGEAYGRQEPARVEMILPARVVLVAAAVIAVVLRFVFPAPRGDDVITPATALAHVPPALAAKPVLNTYNFGGYLIFKGVRTFVDGRADMYGDTFMRRYTQAIGGHQPALDQVLKQYGIAWTIAKPKDGVVGVLDKAPGWKRIYADKYAVVQARIDALPVTAAESR